MATKQAATTDTAPADQDGDTTLLDTSAVAVKRLIAKGKERGYITFDELNAVLPADQNSSEQIEDVMAMLNEMGIQVVESEEGEEGEPAAAKTEKAEGEEEKVVRAMKAAAAGRTTFVIAHRLATIRDADRILFFQDGMVTESGSFDELVARDGLFAALARTQLLAPARAETRDVDAPHLHLVYSRVEPEVSPVNDAAVLEACIA